MYILWLQLCEEEINKKMVTLVFSVTKSFYDAMSSSALTLYGALRLEMID